MNLLNRRLFDLTQEEIAFIESVLAPARTNKPACKKAITEASLGDWRGIPLGIPPTSRLMKVAQPPASAPSDNDDVLAALHLLGESLQGEVQRINKEGAQAMTKGDYDTAQSVIDFAKRLTAFRSKVDALGKEWAELEDLRDKATPAVQEIVSKRFFGRSKRGDITSQEDYCVYILRAIVELGGTAKTKDVIVKVGEKMKAILKPKDYGKTLTRAKELRWENNTRWARQRMVEDGRMKNDTQNGIWAISGQGIVWLKTQPAVSS